jgi:hypothetical protein
MSSSSPAYNPTATDANLVCVACGTQFPTTDRAALPTCFICDDPRQYTPRTGQAFTTMGDVRAAHKNEFTRMPISDNDDGHFTEITTHPKLAIGQRAILISTPAGNVLWDCLTLLDGATAAAINARGGLAAVVISHPHYYSSHAEWGEAFDCPVYLASEDRAWIAARPSPRHRFIEDTEAEVVPGVRAIKLGGHFPGSLVLLYEGRLLIADTLLTTPAGMGSWKTDALGNPRQRPEGMNTFAFMWSIPNSIPLSGEEVFRMWSILKKYDFRSTHGAFATQDIEDENIKQRVLDSMKIQTKYAGWANQHAWNDV